MEKEPRQTLSSRGEGPSTTARAVQARVQLLHLSLPCSDGKCTSSQQASPGSRETTWGCEEVRSQDHGGHVHCRELLSCQESGQ